MKMTFIDFEAWSGFCLLMGVLGAFWCLDAMGEQTAIDCFWKGIAYARKAFGQKPLALALGAFGHWSFSHGVRGVYRLANNTVPYWGWFGLYASWFGAWTSGQAHIGSVWSGLGIMAYADYFNPHPSAYALLLIPALVGLWAFETKHPPTKPVERKPRPMCIKLERAGTFEAKASYGPAAVKCDLADQHTYRYFVRITGSDRRLSPEGFLVENSRVHDYFITHYASGNPWPVRSCELMARKAARDIGKMLAEEGISIEKVECALGGSNGAMLWAIWKVK